MKVRCVNVIPNLRIRMPRGELAKVGDELEVLDTYGRYLVDRGDWKPIGMRESEPEPEPAEPKQRKRKKNEEI